MTSDHAAADRIVALADQCVRCGLCQPVCPTYALDRNEAESPRGRIALMQALALGQLDDSSGALRHLDHCLACRACERVCPAHVRYGELLDLSRAALRAQRRVPLRTRTLEWLLRGRKRFDAAHALARVLRPVSRTLRRTTAPLHARRPWPDAAAGAAPSRGPAFVFAGCLGRHADAGAVAAAAHVLQRIGFEVSLPEAQACCGALHRHAGASAAADALAATNRAAFAGDAPVFTLASGCHEAIGAALDAPGAPRVRPLLGFLAADARFAALPLRPRKGRVALHLPCTQRNVVRDADAVARLLARIPALHVHALPPAHGCCGAAGTHMLDAPERAATLRAPLLDAVADSGAATLCSANVGCRVFLAAGLHTRNLAVDVRHPIELLSEALE